MRVRLTAAFLLLGATLAGCAGVGDADDAPDGHYVNFRWGSSSSNCINGRCTYGSNAEPFEIQLQCRVVPTLTWDAKNWKHGRITAEVLDHDGQRAAQFTLTGDGHGTVPVAGTPGTWTFQGQTSDANGNAEIRLACV